MFIVHHLQRSQSERVVWLCEELGLDGDTYTLALHKRAPLFAPPAIKALSPLGSAPVIQDGALVLAESAAIVEYIIHRYGGGRLAVAPSHANYPDYLYWFHFANSTLQPAVVKSGVSPDRTAVKKANRSLPRVLDVVEARLGRVPWLAGDEFTAADIMNVVSLTTMRLFFPIDLTPYPNILRYLARVGDRKAYRSAMAKGDPGFEPVLLGPPPLPFEGMKL